MYPFQLSGGMARRVLVSTALLSDPKLVVADEPTPGLDQKTVEETLNHFKHMKDDGIGVLLITHDIHAALEVADRIGIFYSGYRTCRRLLRRRRKPTTSIHKSTLQSTACKRIRTNKRTPATTRRNPWRLPILRQMRNEIWQMQRRKAWTNWYWKEKD